MKRKYWSLGALWLYSTILLSAQEVRVHTIGDSTMADYVKIQPVHADGEKCFRNFSIQK